MAKSLRDLAENSHKALRIMLTLISRPWRFESNSKSELRRRKASGGADVIIRHGAVVQRGGVIRPWLME